MCFSSFNETDRFGSLADLSPTFSLMSGFGRIADESITTGAENPRGVLLGGLNRCKGVVTNISVLKD